MSTWVPVIVAALALVGTLAVGYWQYVYKPRRETSDAPADESPAAAAYRQLWEQLEWYRRQFEQQMERADKQEYRLDKALQKIAALEQQVLDADRRHDTDTETIRVLRERVADLVKELTRDGG